MLEGFPSVVQTSDKGLARFFMMPGVAAMKPIFSAVQITIMGHPVVTMGET